MGLITLFRLAIAGLLLGALSYGAPAQQQNNDDVAAAARKSREQQKNAPNPKKVLTNDDLPKNPATTRATPSADANAVKTESGAANTSDTAGTNGPAGEEKGEAYWKKRFQEQRDKIAAAEKELDVLQREHDKDEMQYYPDPQKAMMQQYSRSDINDRAARIAAKKKEVDALNQQLSDMEDQLRKAGGDPGWAR